MADSGTLPCFAGAEAQCEGGAVVGDVRVLGTQTESLVAGRLEVCFEMGWRPVCDDGWDEREAVVTCRNLGFSAEGELVLGG